jgi:glycosyltransferase involved in cell wall biosynthesis
MNINYFSLTHNSGYGQSALGMLQSIFNKENLQLTPINFLEKNNVNFNLYSHLTNNRLKTIDLEIFHSIPDIQRRFKPKSKRIGFAIFESTNPPKHWINILNQNSAVFTPSNFCKNTFIQKGVKSPIYLIPHPLPSILSNFPETGTKEPKINTKKEIFTFIGTFKQRKGVVELLNAWFQTFNKTDDKLLYLKTDSQSLPLILINKLKEQYKKEPAEIIIDNENYNQKSLCKLYQLSDYIILPTKGEGFCLPALEALSMNKKLIITDWSGQKDFVNENNSILLKPERIEIVQQMDEYPQFKNQEWAYVSPEQISSILKSPPHIKNPQLDNPYDIDFIYNNYIKQIFNSI